MSAATEATRNYLVRFCNRSGLKLANIIFEKVQTKFITHTPNTGGESEQIEYSITTRGHIRLQYCETATFVCNIAKPLGQSSTKGFCYVSKFA